MELDAVIQEKLDKDTDFQNSLVDLSDEDKNTAITTKKSELIKGEFESINKKALENEQKFRDQQTRAEKAEAKAKDDKKVDERNGDLTPKDAMALMNAKVIEEEDIDEVVEYAKFKKIPVAEALKLNVVKVTLAEKAEFRKTAEAANIGASRKSVPKLDDKTVIENTFSKGEIPEKGSPDAEALFWAKRGGKK